MPSIIAGLLAEALPVVNELLGVSSRLEQVVTGKHFTDVMVIIDKNKKVTDEYNQLVGFRNEANYLKSDFPTEPRPGDLIFTSDDECWRVTGLLKSTSVKWYVEVVRDYSNGQV